MAFFSVLIWAICLHCINSYEILNFRIRNCSYEFYSNKITSVIFIQVPIPQLEIIQITERQDHFICKVKNKKFIKDFKLFKVESNFTFNCYYKNSEILQNKDLSTVLGLYTVTSSNIKIGRIIQRLITKLSEVSEESIDFDLMISDLIIDIVNLRNIQNFIKDSSILKWWFNLVKNVRDDWNYFSLHYLSSLKNIKIGGWRNEMSTISFEVLREKIYLSLIDNREERDYFYTLFNINSTYRFLIVMSSNKSREQAYLIIVWKQSNNDVVSCSVWFDALLPILECNVTSDLPNWDICRCNKLGLVIIKTWKNSVKMKNQIFRFGGLTPAFIDKMNVKKVEDLYRYGRMGDWLILSSIIICSLNILLVSSFISYYHKRWRCFSPTKRQIMCLFILLWLNILLLQPLMISYFLRSRVKEVSTEYIAWGFLTLYSISAYTFMIGGAQVALFVSTVNSKLWACRFCDFILGFVVIICCAIPLFIFFNAYHSAVVSISRAMLLPEGYSLKNFVLIPSIIVTGACFILSGLSCYLPKRGGGVAMMSAMYPILFLHICSYIMVLLMKQENNTYNYMQYLVYCGGIFFQAIYLLTWFMVLVMLPTKKMTIFGKRDCNFRLEYIYLIDLQCPPPQCTQDQC